MTDTLTSAPVIAHTMDLAEKVTELTGIIAQRDKEALLFHAGVAKYEKDAARLAVIDEKVTADNTEKWNNGGVKQYVRDNSNGNDRYVEVIGKTFCGNDETFIDFREMMVIASADKAQSRSVMNAQKEQIDAMTLALDKAGAASVTAVASAKASEVIAASSTAGTAFSNKRARFAFESHDDPVNPTVRVNDDDLMAKVFSADFDCAF